MKATGYRVEWIRERESVWEREAVSHGMCEWTTLTDYKDAISQPATAKSTTEPVVCSQDDWDHMHPFMQNKWLTKFSRQDCFLQLLYYKLFMIIGPLCIIDVTLTAERPGCIWCKEIRHGTSLEELIAAIKNISEKGKHEWKSSSSASVVFTEIPKIIF